MGHKDNGNIQEMRSDNGVDWLAGQVIGNIGDKVTVPAY